MYILTPKNYILKSELDLKKCENNSSCTVYVLLSLKFLRYISSQTNIYVTERIQYESITNYFYTLCGRTGLRDLLKYRKSFPFLCTCTRSPSYLTSDSIPFGHLRMAISTDVHASAFNN